MPNHKKKIVIVGGGAGGLELIAKLTQQFNLKKDIEITLIDKQLKHLWKPLFHEIAAGTFINYHEEIDYISYAYEKGFKFFLGELIAIHRTKKCIAIHFQYDKSGQLIIPYDVLFIALGSQVNDFGIPGVKKYSLLLDSLPEAEACNRRLLKYIVRSVQGELAEMHIAIVGAGATGVELAAELQYVLSKVNKYVKKVGNHFCHFQVTLIEATKRVLNGLSEKVAHSVSNYLRAKQITILTDTKIAAVKSNGLLTVDAEFIPANLVIWAAGVKGRANTIQHDLEVNQINQFVVRETLQTSTDDYIFAFGDCASCPQKNNNTTYFVPPRAQAAHQQAGFLVKSLSCLLDNKSLPSYRYKDYGSLISLSHHQVIGHLMGKLTRSLYIEGLIARLAYKFLYKQHLYALKGLKFILLNSLVDLFIKKQRPEIKLH